MARASALRARLVEVIEPVTRAAGFDLEHVVVSRVGRRHLVRVIIDRDGGVGLDDIATVSRSISSALDTAEERGSAVVPGEYVLEVSSPGVDRPLTEPRHWRRNVGRLVVVTVTEDGASRRLTGRIRAVTDSAVALEVDGDRAECRGTSSARPGPGGVHRPGEDEPDPASMTRWGAREHEHRPRGAPRTGAGAGDPVRDDPRCDRVRAADRLPAHGRRAPHARVEIDRKTGEATVFAQETGEDGKVVREWDDTPHDFGRIAAMTAKQVILQRLRRPPTRRTTASTPAAKATWSPA